MKPQMPNLDLRSQKKDFLQLLLLWMKKRTLNESLQTKKGVIRLHEMLIGDIVMRLGRRTLMQVYLFYVSLLMLNLFGLCLLMLDHV